MGKVRILITKFLLLLLCFSVFLGSSESLAAKTKTQSKSASGQLIYISIPTPSLEKSILGDATNQPAVVYLPPSYAEGKKNYPVVYYLSGWGNDFKSLTNGDFNGFKLNDTMDKLIKSGNVKDMIIVAPSGISAFLAPYYVNSPVTGNWEDYVVKDVVKYIDSKYRTIQNPKGRGITGHSMGGFGALNAAMKHPDVFGSVYALSPGLYDKNGLTTHGLFTEKSIKEYFDLQKEFEAKPLDEARKELKDSYVNWRYSWEFFFNVSYGSAFSPNPDKVFPLNYPYSMKDGKPVLDKKLWEEWQNGFGGIESQVKKYKSNFLKLSGIGIEYGTKDDNTFIIDGCQSLDKEFKKSHIPCSFNTFDGGHIDKLGERLEKAMIPFFSKELDAKK